ncbi:D-glycero-beta-D-manno-heptose 1-phosphate adenylyltransferase [Nocardioides sp. Kera G14]|uniref:D-glycero-beta-D-manno-heptose 1-phosphate adenylyltransferase n=1 Tax=Nocardioides sp. Kera G14 TaxID=2884264 RepID=UPI001D126669|nr:D-glycero-beta-D-manno-heptose 1-phosphate adenylyltransferase [Nocardioides sp. Kera G14]UDY24977.1 D-glycero-beta-D-manno-heptose 1-phosphate adenylyltransferase [Nocardioides sp. Kera G14]
MTPQRLVVVGDSLLDIDLIGRAGRLMPDAPAPVLDELEERPRPGGAGLAAALLAADGHDVTLVTAVAGDEGSGRLTALLEQAGVRVVALHHSGSTPIKRRVRAAAQSLLRLDEGRPGVIGPVTHAALEAIAEADGVLVADYGNGVTSVPELRDALGAVRAPVVWDPHPRGAEPVEGVRLVTPNRDEATGFAAGVARAPEPTGPSRRPRTELAVASEQAATLVEHWQAHAVCVTLGAKGALLSRGEPSPSIIPAPVVDAVDTCGAGDRFATAVLAAMAGGAVTLEAVHQAVTAAAAFVAAGGAAAYGLARPDAGGPGVVERVRAAGGTVVATGGCFDLVHAGHIATLEAARALGDCLVVCLNSDDSVRRLKGSARPLVTQDDRARVLAALECVDEVVVFDEDTPVEAIRELRPDVWAKGGDYAGAELPEAALLREWGGQAVVLPYLSGRSTTRLVESARTQA